VVQVLLFQLIMNYLNNSSQVFVLMHLSSSYMNMIPRPIYKADNEHL
jgi:hypothetical protein